MLLQDALEYLVHGRIAHRTSFLNPSATPFDPRQRDIKSSVTETNTAKTETQKEAVSKVKNKTTKEEKVQTKWATPTKTFHQKLKQEKEVSNIMITESNN